MCFLYIKYFYLYKDRTFYINDTYFIIEKLWGTYFLSVENKILTVTRVGSLKFKNRSTISS